MELQLKRLVKEKGLSVAEFARAIEVTAPAAYVLLRERRQMRLDTIEKICAALKITPNELFGYETNSSGSLPR